MPQIKFSGDFAYRIAVPILMALVAVIQIFLVENYSLSRWKGGGFGMFTSVDSPSSRFLRIYLISTDGEIPVLVPRELRRLSHQLRVMPTESSLNKLVNKLTEGNWQYLTMISASEHYMELLRDASSDYQNLADDIQHKFESRHARINFENLRMVKMLGKDELPSNDKMVTVLGSRVEVWKYKFDINGHELILKASRLALASSVPTPSSDS